MPATDIGTGATVTFGTSSRTFNIVSVGHDDIGRESIETTHRGTTSARSFIPGDLYDPGGLELEIQLDPNLDTTNIPPFDQAAETITVTQPVQSGDATAGKIAGTGFVQSFSYNDPVEDLITGTVSVKFSGALTITAGST